MVALACGVGMTHTKNCRACAHSYMEPDSDLVCGHPDAGFAGIYARHASAEAGHCGPERPKFQQHPLRKPNGDLKGGRDA